MQESLSQTTATPFFLHEETQRWLDSHWCHPSDWRCRAVKQIPWGLSLTLSSHSMRQLISIRSLVRVDWGVAHRREKGGMLRHLLLAERIQEDRGSISLETTIQDMWELGLRSFSTKRCLNNVLPLDPEYVCVPISILTVSIESWMTMKQVIRNIGERSCVWVVIASINNLNTWATN